MKKLIDNINEYLKITIQSKKNMRKTIVKLENELKEARENEKYAIEQKDKFRKKLREEKKKNKKGNL